MPIEPVSRTRPTTQIYASSVGSDVKGATGQFIMVLAEILARYFLENLARSVGQVPPPVEDDKAAKKDEKKPAPETKPSDTKSEAPKTDAKQEAPKSDATKPETAKTEAPKADATKAAPTSSPANMKAFYGGQVKQLDEYQTQAIANGLRYFGKQPTGALSYLSDEIPLEFRRASAAEALKNPKYEDLINKYDLLGLSSTLESGEQVTVVVPRRAEQVAQDLGMSKERVERAVATQEAGHSQLNKLTEDKPVPAPVNELFGEKITKDVDPQFATISGAVIASNDNGPQNYSLIRKTFTESAGKTLQQLNIGSGDAASRGQVFLKNLEAYVRNNPSITTTRQAYDGYLQQIAEKSGTTKEAVEELLTKTYSADLDANVARYATV